MSKKTSVLFLIVICVLATSGCSFLNSGKKEINFGSEESASVQNDSGLRIKTPEESQEEEAQKKLASQEETALPETTVQNEAPSSKAESPAPAETKVPAFKINDKLVKWGYASSSGRKIDTIIVHSSYNSLEGDEHDLDKILDIYKSYGVSPHYIIARDGKIYRLVEDKNIAYHAGVSAVPDGRKNVNDFSIGIEIVNTKSESPSDVEYSSLKKLISYLKGEYEIKYTLGHSDIAPGRKDDPWKFDWGRVK